MGQNMSAKHIDSESPIYPRKFLHHATSLLNECIVSLIAKRCEKKDTE